MYSIADYRDMIEDPVRASAYQRALQEAIRPGSSVIELGTGVGYFAIVACRAGAERVVAIEPDPAIHLAAQLARANGCADRVHFIQDLSTRVQVEPAEVVVSDLRGVLPLHGMHLPSIVDARQRLLKPGGALIPARDTLWVALVGSRTEPEIERRMAEPPIDLLLLDQAITNTWWKVRLKGEELLSAPCAWHTIDYHTIEGPDVAGTVELVVNRTDLVRGLGVWFDTDLHGGIGFSNAPGAPPVLYGQAYFPLPEPLPVEAGDRVSVQLRGTLVGSGYVWSWRGRVVHGAAAGRAFAQSTLQGTPLAASVLRKRADVFVPRLGRTGEAQAWMLGRMGASASLRVIAEEALLAFPDLFPDVRHALRHVGDLSERFSE